MTVWLNAKAIYFLQEQKQYTFFKSNILSISQLTLELRLALNFDLQYSPLLPDDKLQ